MTLKSFILVLVAALMHAFWNAMAKRGRDKFLFLWCSASIATVFLLPVIVVEGIKGALPGRGWIYVFQSAVGSVLFGLDGGFIRGRASINPPTFPIPVAKRGAFHGGEIGEQVQILADGNRITRPLSNSRIYRSRFIIVGYEIESRDKWD